MVTGAAPPERAVSGLHDDLPEGLQVYAENIFRRFPEEFIALGCPRLEVDYEISPAHGSTRRVSEVGSSKCVEITLRRKASAFDGPMSHPTSPQGAISFAQPASPPHASSEPQIAQLTSKVQALLNRLSGLERRIESQPAAPPVQQPALQSMPAPTHAQPAPAAPAPAAQPAPQPAQSAGGSLASRRGVLGQGPGAAPRAVPVPQPAQPAMPVSQNAQTNNTDGALQIDTGRSSPVKSAPVPEKKNPPPVQNTSPSRAQTGSGAGAQGLSVRTQRVAPASDEPESPRSPGWFSAWGDSKKKKAAPRG